MDLMVSHSRLSMVELHSPGKAALCKQAKLRYHELVKLG